MEHFWTPRPGEKVLGMAKYEDMILVACTDGLWIITPHGKALPDWEIRHITHEFRKEFRDEMGTST